MLSIAGYQAVEVVRGRLLGEREACYESHSSGKTRRTRSAETPGYRTPRGTGPRPSGGTRRRCGCELPRRRPIGTANFVFEKSPTPHCNSSDIYSFFGVASSTDKASPSKFESGLKFIHSRSNGCSKAEPTVTLRSGCWR